MTPETLRIDRSFRGVGRIARASGTTIPAVRNRISRMLTALFEDGRLDVLRAIRDGKLQFLQVLDAYSRRALGELPMGETMQPLATAMAEWIESLVVDVDASAKHIESLETSRRYFERREKHAMVSDLPRLLEELRESLGRKHPRSFNLARTAALAFVRSTLKTSHPLYGHVRAVERRKLAKATKRTPLTLQQMRGFFPKPDTDWLDAIAWGMATTGMHAKEYWGQWSVQADRVHIIGTKRGGRVRDVPLVRRPAVPKYARRKFEDDLRERTRAIVVYDLRRTYANWMEAAGIPRTRRRLYMGHGAGDVTDLYEQHEVTAYLADDAAKLSAFLGTSTVPNTVGAQPFLKVEGSK